ncbi:hypothetical protein M885DRAFT_576043 [Pelagophyceae sp. CCMP2097]|nr:hypothetical protein M885DRAFT_576043 [Pelagophyceae sp. CCMP2097]
MGFGLSDVWARVLSDESHWSEFVCPVCRDLAEDARVTACGHVFCAFCVGQWRARGGQRCKCPSCNADLFDEPPALASCNALAHRILGRVQVQCPLHAQGCKWAGDFSGVQSHLTNSSEHLGTMGAATGGAGDGTRAEGPASSTSPPEAAAVCGARANADALKAQADGKYAARNFDQALALYDKAIALAPGVAAYHANRGACLFMRREYLACCADCGIVVDAPRDGSAGAAALAAKAAVRRARARVELSQHSEAFSELEAAFSALEGDVAAQCLVEDKRLEVLEFNFDVDVAQNALVAGEFGAAASGFATVLKGTEAAAIVLQAAAAELGLGRTERALRMTLQVLRRRDAAQHRGHACVVRGAALVLQDDGATSSGLDLLREAVRLDPDDDDAKSTLRAAKRATAARDGAKAAMHTRDFDGAIAAYSALLDGHLRHANEPSSYDSTGRARKLPLFAKLAARSPLTAAALAERAHCALRCGRAEACLGDCDAALRLKDDCIDAWLTKATALRKLGQLDRAVDELGALMQRWGAANVRIRHAHEQADFEARRFKRPDYYAALGCRHVSTEKEIKGAYREKSLEHHPDRHSSKSADVQKVHEAKFKDLGDALEVLGDTQKRKLYDEGFDKKAIDERIAAHQNPHGHHRH